MQDYGEELPTNFSKSSIPVWQKIQDELIEQLENIRVQHTIEDKFAEERDNMIGDGIDELDDE